MDSKERSYRFALGIIKFIDTLPHNLTSNIIARQLLRSATSIGANIVEAHASSSRKDFTLHPERHGCKAVDEWRSGRIPPHGRNPKKRGATGVIPRGSTNFFNHSLKSANETIYWLHLLKDANICDAKSSNILFAEANEISKILGSSILTLRGKKSRTEKVLNFKL